MVAVPRNVHNALDKFAQRRPGPVRVIESCDQSVLDSIHFGVLFVMSYWSGPARIAFFALLSALPKCDPNGRLEVVVVDNDRSGDLYLAPAFAGKWHGYGETAWFRGGEIIATTGKCEYESRFAELARQLLATQPHD